MRTLLFICIWQGTLHFHLLLYGGLSAYVMQRFAAMKDICNEIASVLDSMFVSEIPTVWHLPAILHKLAEKYEFGLCLKERSREVLLSRPNYLKAANNEGCVTHASLKEATYEQGSKQQHHKHLATCHKGFHGRDGCRLCMGRGECSCTKPVLLDPLPDEVANYLATDEPSSYPVVGENGNGIFAVQADCDCDEDWNENIDEENLGWMSDEDSDVENDAGLTTDGRTYFCENDKRKIPVAFQVIEKIPSELCPNSYSIMSVLQKVHPPPIIVWETSTVPPQPAFASPTDEERNQFRRDDLMLNLHVALCDCPEFADNATFWNQIKQMDDDKLGKLYARLVKDLRSGNSYIGTYNAAISFCTGAHNNAVLLGGDQQAKSATFYMCPYMSKSKYPLQHSLIILQKTLEHVEKNQSVAADTGSKSRTAKRVLQRVLNKMNLKMELSGKCL